jgi:hypothetical protein
VPRARSEFTTCVTGHVVPKIVPVAFAVVRAPFILANSLFFFFYWIGAFVFVSAFYRAKDSPAFSKERVSARRARFFDWWFSAS